MNLQNTNQPHWRIRLFRDSGSMVEAIFAYHEDAVDWVQFRSPDVYPFIEVDELNEVGDAWELRESRNRIEH